MRVDGRGCWNWVFQNDEVVVHVVRRSRGAGVVAEVMDGHRPVIWVSALYGAQRGHAEAWQICLAHQLRDCRYAAEAGDTLFAPRLRWPSAAFSPLGGASPASGRHLRYPEASGRAAPPIRPERHVPHSIASVRRRLAVALIQRLPRCPCCLQDRPPPRNRTTQ